MGLLTENPAQYGQAFLTLLLVDRANAVKLMATMARPNIIWLTPKMSVVFRGLGLTASRRSTTRSLPAITSVPIPRPADDPSGISLSLQKAGLCSLRDLDRAQESLQKFAHGSKCPCVPNKVHKINFCGGSPNHSSHQLAMCTIRSVI